MSGRRANQLRAAAKLAPGPAKSSRAKKTLLLAVPLVLIAGQPPTRLARCYGNAYGYDPARPAYSAWFLDAAGQSGYRPVIAALAQAMSQRMRPAVAHRNPLAMPLPSEMAPAAAASYMHGVSPTRVGQWEPQPVVQPASPYGPRPLQAGVPQPGMRSPVFRTRINHTSRPCLDSRRDNRP